MYFLEKCYFICLLVFTLGCNAKGHIFFICDEETMSIYVKLVP